MGRSQPATTLGALALGRARPPVAFCGLTVLVDVLPDPDEVAESSE